MPNSFVEELVESSEKIYSPQELALLDPKRVPHHIAIIPDGNRRWARLNRSRLEEGHRHGAQILSKIVRAASALGVKALTIYSFSTENWLRSKMEVDFLIELFDDYLREQLEEMISNGVRFDTIGDISKFPPHIIRNVDYTKAATAHGNRIDLVLALNYGGRDEIRRAIQTLVKECQRGQLNPEQITESVISQYLDTQTWPDPDLIIRTSGEMRLSNFLLWQTSYAEIHVTDTLWPDFTPQHLLHAVLNFQKRDRRLGG